jgi:cell shape-determining protein MreD
VRAAGIGLVIIIALALQTSLARFLTPGGGLVDLVFVAVVYIALSSGPTAGMIAGAVAGLSQDALAASGALNVAIGVDDVVRGVSTQSIIGIGSLAKTVVGFFAGIVGSQFIVARPLPRALVFFTATVTHAIIFVGLYRVIDRGYTQATVGAILSQAGANALVGVLLCQIADFLPIFVDRRRSMGGGMRINRRLD